MVDKRKAPGLPTLRLEQGREGPHWAIVVDDLVIFLNLREEEMSSAQDMLARFVSGRKLRLGPGMSFGPLCLYNALMWARDTVNDRLATGQASKRSGGIEIGRIRRLMTYWSCFTVSEVTPEQIGDFTDRRRDGLDPFTDSGPVSKATVKMELKILERAVNKYSRSFGLNGVLFLDTQMRRSDKSPAIISRSEIARLLWATLGYKWDNERQRMVHNSNEHARFKTRQTRLHVARLILIAIYTASDFLTILNLRWDAAETGDESFVELGAERSTLYRLGKDAAPGKQAGIGIVLNRRIVAHLRRWHRQDMARGATHVIMFGNPLKPLQSKPYQTFRNMIVDADLSKELTMECIRHSGCVYLSRRQDVNLRSSSLMVGMSMSSFEEKYGVYRPDYQKEAFDALLRKPRSIR